MLDFITLVDNQIPMDTQSMLQDSENQMVKVMDSTFVVDNLLALEFLNASGKVVNSLWKSCSTGQKRSHPSSFIS